MSSRTIYWALPLSLSLAFAACADEEEPTNSYPGPSTTPGGLPGGGAAPGGGATGSVTPGGTPGAVSPGGTPGTTTPGGTPGTTTPGGTPGTTTPGGMPGTASTGGTTGGATMGGTTGGAPGGMNNFVKCESNVDGGAGTKACGSFVSSMGVTFELGPYGGTMDSNVGVGFEAPGDSGSSDFFCPIFAAAFAEDPEATERLLNVEGLKMELHTVYRPAVWPQGKLPIITWGNGTCAQPEGYGALLRYVASHGFFIVAANNRYVGDGTPQKKALDFAFAANMDSSSPYFGKLDTTKVLAMGHSQGGLGTVMASSDSRIKASILFNGGSEAPKPYLAISGDRDISGTVESLRSAVMGSSQSKAAWLWYHMIPGTGSASGHLTLMTQPERVAPVTVAWIKYILLDDAESKTWFAGTSCKMCGKAAEFEFGQKGIQ